MITLSINNDINYTLSNTIITPQIENKANIRSRHYKLITTGSCRDSRACPRGPGRVRYAGNYANVPLTSKLQSANFQLMI